MNRGHKLQNKFGARLETDHGRVGVLPDNIYFVYGIPRAKFSHIPTVTSRLQEPKQSKLDDHNSDDESLKDYDRADAW